MNFDQSVLLIAIVSFMVLIASVIILLFVALMSVLMFTAKKISERVKRVFHD